MPSARILKMYIPLVFPVTGFMVGSWLDQTETLRMTRFRDKSALYGKVLPPGAQPTWP